MDPRDWTPVAVKNDVVGIYSVVTGRSLQVCDSADEFTNKNGLPKISQYFRVAQVKKGSSVKAHDKSLT